MISWIFCHLFCWKTVHQNNLFRYMWKSESTLPFQSYCESSIEVDDPPSDHRHTKKQLKFSFPWNQHHQYYCCLLDWGMGSIAEPLKRKILSFRRWTRQSWSLAYSSYFDVRYNVVIIVLHSENDGGGLSQSVHGLLISYSATTTPKLTAFFSGIKWTFKPQFFFRQGDM